MLDELVADLVGVPHAMGGRDPKIGLDCYGLVMEVARRQGFYAPEFNDPVFMSQIWTRNEKECEGFLKYSHYGFTREGVVTLNSEPLYDKLEKSVPGCVVLLMYIAPFASHCGVVLDDCNRFIHAASKNKSVCIERLSSIQWAHRIKGYYKWMKLL